MRPRKHSLGPPAGLVAGFLAGLLVLGACAPLSDIQGHVPEEEQIAKIEPKISNQGDVLRLLGSPSNIGTFETTTWYYISKHTETFAFFEKDILKQQVLAITFAKTGIVEKVERFGLDDARKIELVERVTPTRGKELGLFQQIFGNIGRFTGEDSGGGLP